MATITIPIPDPVNSSEAEASAANSAATQTQGSKKMAAPIDLGDLMTVFAADIAQANRSAQAVSDNIRNQSAYALTIDNRLVTGAVAAQIAAAGEPDAFAGLNSGVRTPITLDQPGNYPQNVATAK